MPDTMLPADMATESTASSCIGKLRLKHRLVINLIYYHERSVAEVAEILDIPRGTVKTRMFHARRQLAMLLESAGISSVGADFVGAQPTSILWREVVD